ncbi:hypothetical protein FOA52_016195 [Chlamydomonas sp. UWO 241]|nr:hypothetical protein FOA52_016195 [Chlamydomonas sp. UWO 241]
MLRPPDWVSSGCLTLTKNVTVVGRAPGNGTTHPVVHMGWLTRIIKLNPGVWLTFEGITMKGFRPILGSDFAFLCYSPDSVLYQQDVVSENPRGIEIAVRVPGLINTPRQGIPGVQEVSGWSGSYCFDTVRTSQCYPESTHLADLAGIVPASVQGLGGSGGYVRWFINSTLVAPKLLDPVCIQQYGNERCYADAVAVQLEIDFPSSPPPPLPATPPRPGAPPAPPTSGTASSVNVASIVAPVVVSCVALLAVAVFARWWYKRRRQALPLHLRFAEPQPGPDTTLVVTDIQDSTNMWETLPGDVMDECLVTHNAIMRRCLSEYHGTESATEGDAFIMAFHTATEAVSFCLSVQEQLMAAEWPAELLAHASACEVFATPTRQLRLEYGTEESTMKPSMDEMPYDKVTRVPGASLSINIPASYQKTTSAESLSATLPTPTPTASLRTTALIKGAAAKSAFLYARSPSTYNSSYQTQEVNLNALHMILGSTFDKTEYGCEDEEDAMPMNRTWLEHLRNGWLLRSGAISEPASELNVNAGAARIASIDSMEPHHPRRAQFSNEATELMLFRGLRVRMGVHSGVAAADISHNKASAHTQYGGSSLSRARHVCDATPGGAVLLSKAAFLATTKGVRAAGTVTAHVGDFRKEADLQCPSEALPLYAAVRPQLLARYVAGAPLKVDEKVSGGVFDAPVGSVTMNFMYMPCHKMLRAVRPELADLAASTFSTIVTACVHKHNGYVVEHDDGFCLSAFRTAIDAVQFCIDMKALMMTAPWPAELLEHELCEEVTEGNCVVMRGPRLKSGSDSCTQVFTAINPSSGRMVYRGKVMNRAARIASKAASGVSLVSGNCWAECMGAPGGEAVFAHPRDAIDLKGIGKLEVYQLYMPLPDLAHVSEDHDDALAHIGIDVIRARRSSVGPTRSRSRISYMSATSMLPPAETATLGPVRSLHEGCRVSEDQPMA